jgi:hypothetical protein
MERCSKHLDEETVGTCRDCAEQFCSRCLVFPQGPSRPALCVGCALAIAGARSKARQKSMTAERVRTRTLHRPDFAKVPAAAVAGAESMAGRVRLLMLMNGLAVTMLVAAVFPRA